MALAGMCWIPSFATQSAKRRNISEPFALWRGIVNTAGTVRRSLQCFNCNQRSPDMLTYDHFNGSILQDIREKIGAIAQIVQDDLIDDIGGESYGCPDISPVYGFDPGGFIPFQHGGFMVTELYRHDIDSSYHITKGQTLAAQEHEKLLYDCFASDYRKELEAAGVDPDSDDYSVPESLEETFDNYESEFWEPALLRFCVFISKPNHENARKVELSLALNYSDAPYYREGRDDDILATLAYDLPEFLTLDPDKILQEFKARISFG